MAAPTLNELLIGVNSANEATNAKMTFTTEIMHMMHGFGDSERPLVESAQLMEDIVRQQMMSLLVEAVNVATQRGSRTVSIEEILFLIRKDRSRLVRLLRHLHFKDSAPSGGGGQASPELDLEALLSGLPPSGPGSGQDLAPRRKRLKICSDFLSSIDDTGQLVSALELEQFDEIKHRRNLRIEQMTRTMTESQYLNYCQSRRASFACRSQPNKFRDWLLSAERRRGARDEEGEQGDEKEEEEGDSELTKVLAQVKLDNLAIEVLQYLAFETVALIVDYCFLVKQDRRRDTGDPVASLMPVDKMKNPEMSLFQSRRRSSGSSVSSEREDAPLTPFEESTLVAGSPCKQSRNVLAFGPCSSRLKNSDTGTKCNLEMSPESCIQVSDIREVTRRFFTQNGPFVILQKGTSSKSVAGKLFALR
ncbi:Transcription initiation protein SPT3 -like protein [Halotydeus destructor]|nr:Transcription initiation protein SPT3 -like protein [Halotydeus destructor]